MAENSTIAQPGQLENFDEAQIGRTDHVIMKGKIITHSRVIHALILREMKTRFGRAQLGYLWALIEPALYVLIFLGLYALRGRTAVSGMPIAVFLLTGAIPFIMFRDTMMRSMIAIQSNRPLLTFPQVTPIDLVLGRALLEMATTLVAFALLIVIFVATVGPVKVADPLGVFVWLAVLGLLGFGAGAAFGALAPLFPSVQQLVPSILIRPLFFVSGLFFTAEMIPEQIRDYALLNPLLQLTELVRAAFFHEFESPHTDVTYVVLFTLVTLFLGLAIQRALLKRILTLPP
jgi:capsular polysaccharide transport system permease protein